MDVCYMSLIPMLAVVVVVVVCLTQSMYAQCGQDDGFDGTVLAPPTQVQPGQESAIDPTGVPLEQVISILREAVATCVGCDPASLRADLPLMALGMDSMRGIQLQGILEKRFTVQLPDELMFEPDATLMTIGSALVSGGLVKVRPYIINAWEVIAAARKQLQARGKKPPKGRLPAQWFRENSVKANVDTLMFKDGCGLGLAPLSLTQELYYFLLAFNIFGVFFWFPLGVGLIFYLLPLYVAMTVIVFILSIIYFGPYQSWPPAFQRSLIMECVTRYFSYRIIVEKDFDHSTPAIYAFSPHGVFAIAPSIQILLNEFVMGENFHFLAATAAFYVPIYNISLKLMGFKTVDKPSFMSTLKSGRSVGIVPGGIAEMFKASDPAEVLMVKQRKGFVKLALETGSQIVPCYCFGNTQTFSTASGGILASLSRMFRVSLITFWGRWGLPLPRRSPLVTVIGRPIYCPQVVDPSVELINEYHTTYLKEMRRIYDRYKNVYQWQDKKLVFQD